MHSWEESGRETVQGNAEVSWEGEGRREGKVLRNGRAFQSTLYVCIKMAISTQVHIIKPFYREPALPYLQQINFFVQLRHTLGSGFSAKE